MTITVMKHYIKTEVVVGTSSSTVQAILPYVVVCTSIKYGHILSLHMLAPLQPNITG